MSETLSDALVTKVASLARLKLSDAERSDYAQKLGGILEYVRTLNEINTDGIEPMVHAVELVNVFREDVVRESLPRVDALLNAPKSDGISFLVPEILAEK